MSATELICIKCPMGCALFVEKNADGFIVSGNQCLSGNEHAHKEMTNPTRNIATSIRVKNGEPPMLSVKTSSPIPKGLIMDVVKAVHAVKAEAPVSIGDVMLADVLGTGVDIVATRHVTATRLGGDYFNG